MLTSARTPVSRRSRQETRGSAGAPRASGTTTRMSQSLSGSALPSGFEPLTYGSGGRGESRELGERNAISKAPCQFASGKRNNTLATPQFST